MRVKNPQNVSNWKFYIEDPSGVEVVIPPSDPCNSLNKLLGQVLGYIQVYDNMTQGEYSKKQRELAVKDGLDFEDYMLKVIEHQVCLRAKGTIPCWKGTGDLIHSALGKVDNLIDHSPEIVRNVMQRAVSSATPSKTKKFGSCSACGGSRSFSPSVDNLGRANKLNNIL